MHRRRTRTIARLVVLALVAATLATLAPQAAAPVAADGNEAPGAPLAFRSITAGTNHSCAILPSGAVKCWGSNGYGQLGQGSTATLGDGAGEMAALPAVNLGAGRTATAVTAAGNDTCALLDNGTVKCWGQGSEGQLGQGSTATLGDGAGEMAALPAVNLGAGRTAAAVSAGGSHTCALLDDGTVKCWGFNVVGQLGQDSTAALGDGAGEMAALPAVNLGAGRTATAVTAGDIHTCALLDDGTVKCWGYNGFGQLGQDSTAALGDGAEEMAALPAVNLGAGRTATAVTAGAAHTCALLDDGTVKCWGYNDFGQLGQDSTAALGDGAEEMAALPAVNLGAGRTATAVTAGALHTCALLDDGTVKCWGYNNAGQLGQGSTAVLGDGAGEMAALPAVNLGAGRTATAVTAGGTHTCASLDDGTVKCWGFNSTGQLGQGSTANLGDQAGEMAALPAIVFAAPALSVQMSADESSVTVGATVHLHVKVRNTGNVALTNVAITDANAPGCEAAPFAVAVGADHSVDCTHVATAGEVAGGYHNSASVTSTEVTTPVVSNTVDVAVLAAPAPALTVQLSADESSVTVGETVHLHVKVRNTGNVALTNVAITDANATGCEAAPFSVAVGADNSVDCTHVATADEVAGGYHSSASVTSTEVTTPVVSNTVDVTVLPVPAPALTVVASADEVSVAPGQVIHQHLVVSNTGNVALHAVTISDPGAPDCADDGVFDLAVDTFTTIDCVYTATGNDTGTYTNEASVTADEVTTPVASNPVEVTVDDAVTVTLSADQSSVVAGQPIGYHVTVRNTSALTLNGLAVVDDAAPECAGGLGFGILSPGAQIVVNCTHVSAVADVGTFSNVATVDSSQIVAVESNQVDVTVAAQAPALSVSEAADPTEVVAGEPIDLALTVTNTGNVALHRITVADPSVPGCQVKVFDLPVGAHRGVFCSHVSTGADVPIYQNQATVTADELAAAVDSNVVSVAVTIPAGESHVAGTVTEAGSGVPIGGAVAVLLSPTDFSPVAVGTADAAGHFSTLAAPGSYFVYVVDPTGGHAAGFHGSPSVVAAAVDATTAADTVLVSLRGAISGTVTGDSGGGPLANVLAMSVDLDRGRLGAGALTDDTGTYRISGLRPGPRLLQFVDLDGGHRPEFFDDASTPAASALLSVVGASQATANAGLGSQDAPGGGAHLVGQLTATTGEPLAGVAVLAVHASDLSLAAGVVTDSTGHYDLDLDAGAYKVAFYDPSGDHDFEWFDDQGTDGLADAATVTAGETPATVDAALSPNTARVAGTVTDSGSGALLDGVLVAAIDATGTVVGLATTNPDGTYLLSGLPAGPVRLRFVDLSGTHVAEYHLDAADYLSATPVTVTAGGVASTIDAALAPNG